jgi:hypothetical protein
VNTQKGLLQAIDIKTEEVPMGTFRPSAAYSRLPGYLEQWILN